MLFRLYHCYKKTNRQGTLYNAFNIENWNYTLKLYKSLFESKQLNIFQNIIYWTMYDVFLCSVEDKRGIYLSCKTRMTKSIYCEAQKIRRNIS